MRVLKHVLLDLTVDVDEGTGLHERRALCRHRGGTDPADEFTTTIICRRFGCPK
jgi:hypothetical protein